MVTVECFENQSYCSKVSDCVSRQLWARLQQAIVNVLESMMLQDLIDQAKGKETA